MQQPIQNIQYLFKNEQSFCFKYCLRHLCLIIQTLFYFDISRVSSMFKDVNTSITKGSIEITEYYSQQNITKEAGEQRDKILSQRSIKEKKKQQEVIWYASKQQKISCTIIRNIMRHILKKIFGKMLQRLVIKKSAYQLLTSKKKRDVENAFLQIKYHKIHSKHLSFQSFFQKHVPAKILAHIVNKKQGENLVNAFNCLKYLAIRVKKVIFFSQLFWQHLNQFIKRSIYSDVFNRLKRNQIIHYEREFKTNHILKIDQLRIRNLQQFTLNKMVQTILLEEYRERSKLRQSKNAQLLGIATSRKQTLAQIRQQLKTAKTNIQQQKLNKNKVFQERKKFTNNNKVATIEQVRKFQKQFKAEQAITKEIQLVYNQRQRIISIRNNLRQKSQGRQNVCLALLAAFDKSEGDRIKKLSDYSSQIDNQIAIFKQSQQFLFKQNCWLQKLIELYQKREPYNYQSQYYQLQYENNVIRQMIRCFIKQKSFAQIQKRKRMHEQQNS